MFKAIKNENWQEVKFKKGVLRLHYAVSNQGRVASYTTNINKDGNILKGSRIDDYAILNIRPDGKSKTMFVHKMVAENFCKKISPKQVYVIHLDFNKSNNSAKNLKWANASELANHQQKNPKVIKARKERKKIKPTEGPKLTIMKVKQIKKLISAKKRTLKMSEIASKFNISEMQLYRIKRGENWSHVKAD